MTPINYSERVAEWFAQPVASASGSLTGSAGSLQQGTLLCITADSMDGSLCNVGFRAFACPHIIAACHWLVAGLEGRPVQALREFPLEQLRSEFDIPAEKTGKLLILQDALSNCYASYAAGQPASDPL